MGITLGVQTPVFDMDKEMLKLSKRMIIAGIMTLAVALVMLVTYVWNPGA